MALGRLDTLRGNSAFGGWLAMITRKRASDFHRRAPHAAEVLPDALSGSNVGKPERDTEALAALAAIGALPETYREALILRLVEGMTGPEIAAHRHDARLRAGQPASRHETASRTIGEGSRP